MPPNAFGVADPTQAAEFRVFWQSDLDAALDIAKRDGRKVVVHFVGPFGGGDRFIERVENTPEVRRFLALQSVPVKIDVDAQPALVNRLKITRVPTVCIFSYEGELIDKFAAPEEPRDYLIKLEKMQANAMRIQVPGLPAPQPYNPGPESFNSESSGYDQPLLSQVIQPIAPQPPQPLIDFHERNQLVQQLELLRQQNFELQKQLHSQKEQSTRDSDPTSESASESESPKTTPDPHNRS
jgi:hypothetical protein